MKKDGKKIFGYRDAMTLEEQPKEMVIVGSGAIGIEFAYFYNALGTDVTIVEFLPNIDDFIANIGKFMNFHLTSEARSPS